MENIHMLEGALSDLCKAYNEEKFKPILEADIAGYLYHLLVVYKDGDASIIHLSTRIQPTGGLRKYPDLVVGYITPIQSQQEYFKGYSQSDGFKKSHPGEDGTKIVDSKGFVDWLKPYVGEREIAIEIKPFLNGFSQQQCHHRIEKSKKDIDTLGQLGAKSKFLLVFDEKGYLCRSNRIEDLAQYKRKNKDTSGIRIIYFSLTSSGDMKWQYVD